MSVRAKGRKREPFAYSIEETKGKSSHTFIFIHDIGFDRRLWFPVMTDIGKSARAIAYDLDGFGANSGRLLPPHTMEYHVDTLFDVIKRTRAKNPVLIGVRFGAHIALQALRRDGEQAERGAKERRLRGAMIGGVLPYPPTAAEYAQLSELIGALSGKRGKAGTGGEAEAGANDESETGSAAKATGSAAEATSEAKTSSAAGTSSAAKATGNAVKTSSAAKATGNAANTSSAPYADNLLAQLEIGKDISPQVRRQISSADGRNIAAALIARLTRPSAIEALLAFQGPVCMLSGQLQAERIQKECINISFNQPNMTVVRIPNSTTLYNLENHAALQSAIRRFIKLFEKE